MPSFYCSLDVGKADIRSPGTWTDGDLRGPRIESSGGHPDSSPDSAFPEFLEKFDGFKARIEMYAVDASTNSTVFSAID